jgi:hypothetical protein
MNYGIDTSLRHRAVGASAEHPNPEAISGRGHHSRTGTEHTRSLNHDVLRQDDVRFGKAVEESVVDHCLGTLACFLSGLEDGHYSAPPRVARSCEQRRGAN